MALKRKKFAQLLTGAVNAAAAFEEKSTRAVADEFGAAIGRSAHTIENYKSAKAIPTDSAQVRILATLGVRRARLNAVWLREFLDSLDYPESAALIAELYGQQPEPAPEEAHQARRRWYDNLEPSPFGRFVMRHTALVELIDGLRTFQTVVLFSIGGMGKTSLAYYLATRCKALATGTASGGGKLPAALPAIDSVVWLSDRSQPGSLTLTSGLDTVARTLDHAGLTALPDESRRQAVEQVLQRCQALLIIDNFETITDPQLLPWLLQLPPPTRVLITTRKRVPAFLADHICLLELPGMERAEVSRLVSERAAQIQLGGALGAEELHALTTLTGGNPFAIRQILGYLKQTGQALADAVPAFGAVQGDLSLTLFTSVRPLLSDSAERTLLAMSLFPSTLTREAASEVAELTGSALDAAIRQLSELALVEIQHDEHDPRPRLNLHPLTRHFVKEHSQSQTDTLARLRERWLAWAVAYAQQFGYQLHELDRLRILDKDQESLFAALVWAAEAGRDQAVIELARGIEFYYYIRGWWGRKSELHQYFIAAAERSGNQETLVAALTMHIQHLCRLGQAEMAAVHLNRLAEVSGVEQLGGEVAFHIAHARALYALRSEHYSQAEAYWRLVLDNASAWALPEHMAVGARHWLGQSMVHQGRQQEAGEQFRSSLEAARAAGYSRWVARNQIQLARLTLTQGELREANKRLAEALEHTAADDREQLAHYYRARAYLHRAQNHLLEAQTDYNTARELFDRMGLAHELRDDESALVTLRWGSEQ